MPFTDLLEREAEAIFCPLYRISGHFLACRHSVLNRKNFRLQTYLFDMGSTIPPLPNARLPSNLCSTAQKTEATKLLRSGASLAGTRISAHLEYSPLEMKQCKTD